MTFSDRVGRISESATMAVTAEAARLKRAGVDVMALGAGEPDFPTPENIKRAGIQAIEDNFTRYTAAGGIPDLKEAIVAWHARELGTSYSASECIATVGGKHAIFNCMAALVSQGDEVILPVPYWVTFFDVINYYGGTPVKVTTHEANAFALTTEDLESAITERTKVVVVNSPNNPSGGVVQRDEFERILELTSSRGIVLLSDECYSHLVYDSDPFSIAAADSSKEHVVVAGSLSKTFAMTGWRMGYLLGSADADREREQIAEPCDLESIVHRAKSRDRGSNGIDGRRVLDAGAVSRPAGVRRRGSERHSRRRLRTAERCVLRLSERQQRFSAAAEYALHWTSPAGY